MLLLLEYKGHDQDSSVNKKDRWPFLELDWRTKIQNKTQFKKRKQAYHCNGVVSKYTGQISLNHKRRISEMDISSMSKTFVRNT